MRDLCRGDGGFCGGFEAVVWSGSSGGWEWSWLSMKRGGLGNFGGEKGLMIDATVIGRDE